MSTCWTTVSQGLGSGLKCGRFSINVETMKDTWMRIMYSQLYSLPLWSPQAGQMSSIWWHFPNPGEKFTWSLDMTAIFPPARLHRALIKFRVGFSRGKVIGPPLDTIEPAHLYEKEIPGPPLPGLGRESKHFPTWVPALSLVLSNFRALCFFDKGLYSKSLRFPAKTQNVSL